MKSPKGPKSWVQSVYNLLSSTPQGDEPSRERRQPLSGDVHRNAAQIQKIFGKSEDLVVRSLTYRGRLHAGIVYLNGATSKGDIAEFVVKPILDALERGPIKKGTLHEVIIAAKVTAVSTVQEAIKEITNGSCILFEAGSPTAYAVAVEEWPSRNIQPPQFESTQAGPAVGFTEDLMTKLAQIRRRLRTPNFRIEQFDIGIQVRTPVAITYIENIVRAEIVEEVRNRLKKIEIDAIIDTNYIKELILDSPWSPWPSFQVSERPDRVVSALLEGQVAILIDGSPWALIVPATLDGFLQSADDYYLHFYPASFTRLLRWIAVSVALLAPSLFVSLLSYHHELIPSSLLFTILASRERVPFPPFLEALLMEGSFEILREAGLRMPQQIGPALSIVGGLVIGEAAVRAGLVSPLMIVVVGMTAIATFVIPSREFNNSVRLLRFPALVAAGMLGLFGVIIFLMFTVALLLRMRSFGVPLTMPIIPLWSKGLGDSVVRAPWWQQRFRPWHMARPDEIRSLGKHQTPSHQSLKDKDRQAKRRA